MFEQSQVNVRTYVSLPTGCKECDVMLELCLLIQLACARTHTHTHTHTHCGADDGSDSAEMDSVVSTAEIASSLSGQPYTAMKIDKDRWAGYTAHCGEQLPSNKMHNVYVEDISLPCVYHL